LRAFKKRLIASTFKFQVRRSPVFAEIGSAGRRETINLPDSIKPILKYHGIELDEPLLIFSNKNASSNVTDSYPIRGILNNRPLDYSLTLQGLVTSVRIGVVSPQAEA